MNSRKCEICIVDVHKASYAKHIRIRKHLENEKQNKMSIPERLLQDSFEKKIKKL